MTADDDGMRRRAVADLVRHQRGVRGLTVVNAAKAAGIGRSTWTEIESGQSPIPKQDTLGKVAQAIDLDANDLFVAAGYTKETPRVVISQGHSDGDVTQLIADIAGRLERIERRLVQQDADRLQLRIELTELRDEVQQAQQPPSRRASQSS